MTQVQQVRPEPEELAAIKAFCQAEIVKRESVKASNEELKGLRAELKKLRDGLMAPLRAVEHHCVMMSKADAKRLDTAAAAAGVPPVPPYLRLTTNSKDSAVTPEVIQEAIECITPEDLTEAAAEVGQAGALRHVVLANIRRLVRSFVDRVTMHPGVPRGLNVYDISEASSAMADVMLQMWTLEVRIKAALEARKQAAQGGPQTDGLKDRIEGLFVRTGLTAQRIVVEGRTYRLVRRVSVRKPKVGMTKLEEMLTTVLAEPALRAGGLKTSELIRGLHIQLASVPPETKTSVSLCAVRQTDS